MAKNKIIKLLNTLSLIVLIGIGIIFLFKAFNIWQSIGNIQPAGTLSEPGVITFAIIEILAKLVPFLLFGLILKLITKAIEKFGGQNQKGFINIILVVIIVILVGAVGYFAFVKKSEPVAQQPTSTPLQTKTPAPTQTPKVETTNWLSFNSVKDTGIKSDFSFKHPSNWIQKGSIDGGAASYIPFYDKDTYSQKCDEAVNAATTCHVTGQVASALVSSSSMSPAKIEYNSETKEAITIDGYQGTKITGSVKSGVELNAYIGKPGQKEMRAVVPNVNGIRFEFTMLIESKTDEATFSEILKTIVFNF